MYSIRGLVSNTIRARCRERNHYMYAIETFNLYKTYGWFFSKRKVHALNNLALTVPENVIYGFLGPNGAGKTTTIKILLGLVIASKGHSKIFGINTDDPATRNHVGFLPENPRFYPYLSARDFLDFCGKLIHMESMERAKRSEELLEKVGLSHAADQKIEGFSRGMLQRVGIAQALISDPDLIILDEPITGLDPMGRADVKKILMDLRNEGKTIFFSSHILSDVEKMCDMVGILNRGRLIESGSLSDLRSDIGFELHTAGVNPDCFGRAQEWCDYVTLKKGDTIFTLTDKGRLPQLQQLVKDNGGTITKQVRMQEELETFFLRRIREDEQERAAAGGKGGGRKNDGGK